jgi:hypothetical protein
MFRCSEAARLPYLAYQPGPNWWILHISGVVLGFWRIGLGAVRGRRQEWGRRGRVGLVGLALAHRTGHVGRLHLADCVIDRRAPAFVEDFHAEDLGCSHCAVFVGAGDGDVEGQDLIGVPGRCQFLVAADFRQTEVIDLIDGGADGRAGRARQAGGEDGRGAYAGVLILGTDFILVGHELALGFLEEVQEAVAVEVDPDQAAGDAALVARVGTAVGRAHRVDGCLLTGNRVVDRLER